MAEGLSFGSLLVISLVAVAAPLLARATGRLMVPGVVLEIVAGIVLGPSVLGWVEVDAPVAVLALVGLAFLLFLAGLEIDLRELRGSLLRLPLLGFAATLALGLVAGLVFDAAGWVGDPVFLAIVLSATSLGLVVPVLKDVGQSGRPLGRYTVAGATIADFGAVVLLSLFFSESGGSTASVLVSLGLFVVVIVAVAVVLAGAQRDRRIDALLVQLQDTTAEIRVRIAVVLLVGFVALAAGVGLELILGAFVAGAVLGIVDRDMADHPHLRTKLEGIGYGFVVPVFFVSSGVRFDLDALTGNAGSLLRVPVFLAALLVVRFVPALLYARVIGRPAAVTAGLLQATSLPFIVAGVEIGMSLDVITPATGAALVGAGLVSVVLFPPLALARLRRDATPDAAAEPALPIPAVRPMGTQH